MKNNSHIYLIIVAILLIGAAFYGGMQYQKLGASQTQNSTSGNAAKLGQGQLPGNGQNRVGGGGLTTGEILSLDNQSLTVKMPNGSTKIVFYSATTPIVKQSDATTADLKAGETVMVTATTNPDGSVSAREIRVGKITVVTPLNAAAANNGQATPSGNQIAPNGSQNFRINNQAINPPNFPAAGQFTSPAGAPIMPPPVL